MQWYYSHCNVSNRTADTLATQTQVLRDNPAKVSVLLLTLTDIATGGTQSDTRPSMAASGRIRNRLNTFESHFKWLDEFDIKSINVEGKIKYLEIECDLERFYASTILAFLSYLYTMESPVKDLRKALTCIEEAEKLQGEHIPYAVDCELILKANKAHVLLMLREHREAQVLITELAEEAKTITCSKEAAIYGTKALTYLRLGSIKYYHKGFELSKKALELDKESPHWWATVAEFHSSLLSLNAWKMISEDDIRVIQLENACLLSQFSIPLYLIRYADILSRTLGPLHKQKKNDEETITKRAKCEELIEQALGLCDNHHEIYRLAGIIYSHMCEPKKQRDILQKGLDKCSRQSNLCTALGKCYLHCKPKFQNLETALDLFTFALNEREGRAFPSAQLNIIRAKIKLDPKYIPKSDLVDLANTKMVDKHSLVQMRVRKELGAYFLRTRQTGEAIDEFLGAMEEEKNMFTETICLGNLKYEIAKLLQDFVDKEPSADNLLQLGYFYSNLKPTFAYRITRANERHGKCQKEVFDQQNLIDFEQSEALHKKLENEIPTEVTTEEFQHLYDKLSNPELERNYELTKYMASVSFLKDGAENLLRAKEAYGQIVKQYPDSSHINEARIEMANILIALRDYSKAIDIITNHTDIKQKNVTQAKAKMMISCGPDITEERKMKLYEECVQVLCVDAVHPLLDTYKNKIDSDVTFLWNTALYESCGYISQLLCSEQRFHLQGDTEIPSIPSVGLIETVLQFDQFDGYVRTLRQQRLKMCTDADTPHNINTLIQTCRNYLDRIHRQFAEKHYPLEKRPQCKFPRVKATDYKSKEEMSKILGNLMESPKKDYGRMVNFTAKFPELFQDLCDAVFE